MAAMRNTSFLCGAIWATTILAVLSDAMSEGFNLHPMDICDLLMVLLVAIYLRVAEPDPFREVIQGMLSVVMLMLVVIYWPRW